MRVLIGSLVAAIAVFIWSFIAWAAFDLHAAAFDAPKDEAVLAPVLEIAMPESGIYIMPGEPEHTDGMTDEEKTAARTDWERRATKGPVVFVAMSVDGMDPNDFMPILRGFGMTFVAALIAAVMVSVAGIRVMVGRLFFVILLAIFTAVVADGGYWNWFGFSSTWTVHFAVDRLIGWTLGGVAIAAIVKPKPA